MTMAVDTQPVRTAASVVRVPFVLAGGSGCFNTGQYLSFDGEPHNKLMVSICQAMGLTNDTFGKASFGAGPLAGLLA